MKTFVRVQRTSKGAIYVYSPELGKVTVLRTRSFGSRVSNKEAAQTIIAHVLSRIVASVNRHEPYEIDFNVSDENFTGAIMLELRNTTRGFTVYKGDLYLPCVKWFKKLTGIKPPKQLYISAEVLTTA